MAVAGGVEAMSATHFELWNARYGDGTGNNVLVDPIVEGAKRAQPQETYGVFGMGDTAENVAEQFHISREDMDEFAFHSQRKAAEAVAAGVFKDEIVPVVIPQRKKEPIVFDTDEQPRAWPSSSPCSAPTARARSLRATPAGAATRAPPCC